MTYKSVTVLERDAKINARSGRLVDRVLRARIDDLVDDGADCETEEADGAEQAREDEGAAAGEEADEGSEGCCERAGENDVGCAFGVRAKV